VRLQYTSCIPYARLQRTLAAGHFCAGIMSYEFFEERHCEPLAAKQSTAKAVFLSEPKYTDSNAGILHFVQNDKGMDCFTPFAITAKSLQRQRLSCKSFNPVNPDSDNS
jgi:hypothetical protein